jgi:hypothetical protein
VGQPWSGGCFWRLARLRGGTAIRFTAYRSFFTETLTIQFRDGQPDEHVQAARGQVSWEEPTSRAHRTVNAGGAPDGEITIFFLAQPDDTPQAGRV